MMRYHATPLSLWALLKEIIRVSRATSVMTLGYAGLFSLCYALNGTVTNALSAADVLQQLTWKNGLLQLAWLLALLIIVACYLLSMDSYLRGEKESFLTRCKLTCRLLPRFIFALGIYFFCVSLGTALFVLPGLLVASLFFFVIPLSLLSTDPLVRLFRLSYQLVCSAPILVITVCFAAFAFMALFVSVILLLWTFTNISWMLLNALFIVANALQLSISIVSSLVLLHELVIRQPDIQIAWRMRLAT